MINFNFLIMKKVKQVEFCMNYYYKKRYIVKTKRILREILYKSHYCFRSGRCIFRKCIFIIHAQKVNLSALFLSVLIKKYLTILFNNKRSKLYEKTRCIVCKIYKIFTGSSEFYKRNICKKNK